MIITDESYFELGALWRGGDQGVLQQALEEYKPQNMEGKFQCEATFMFADAILYGHDGKFSANIFHSIR